ncbi:diaminopimelate epimerase [Methylogaea oryzae]|uniref:Diaminopimelate epimerase n=1 Tax=Methylogaea oryzae TaxID=1295382 RepID=A0A8D4VR67_9GAMM|nr:diaminopimelate epimerase [Methylogaea oryzae]BBL72321.1 diaminopimelate epimerase [Methylogaea oryzae]
MLRFTKMHGLGNDFVVFDAVNQTVALTPDQLRQLADRHFGIGCDQILLVQAPIQPDAHFHYRIFNADGSEVSQCGNGARCFARFVREKGLCLEDEIRVDTRAGRLLLRHRPDGQITVDMGVPRFAPADIPLKAEQESVHYTAAAGSAIHRFGAVSMGNPHAVLPTDDVDTAPVDTVGPLLESHASFPERANIGFMQKIDAHHIRLRVYERGSGETLACGSGACAAAVVGIEQGLLQTPVRVDLPGGSLYIEWQGRGAPVLMSGPATTVFEGTLEL